MCEYKWDFPQHFVSHNLKPQHTYTDQAVCYILQFTLGDKCYKAVIEFIQVVSKLWYEKISQETVKGKIKGVRGEKGEGWGR